MAGRHGDSFALGDLFDIIGRRRGLILKTALCVIALSAIAIWLFVPVLYAGVAKITIETQKNTVADQAAILSTLPTDTPTLQNQIQILTSRDLATEVIARLRLYSDPEFNVRLAKSPFALDPRNLFKKYQPFDPDREADEIVGQFERHLSADALGLSTSIAIGFTSKSARKAQRIANAIADIYVEDQLRAKRSVAEATTRWLAERIRVLGQQVQASESAAEQFKTANHLAEAADGTPLIDQQIAQLNAQLVQAKTDLAQKEATSARIRVLSSSGDSAGMSQVISSPTIVQLRGQETDLIRDEAQLATRYGKKHPKMVAAEKQRHDLEDKISAEVGRIGSAMGSDVQVSRAAVASLTQSLEEAEREAQIQNLMRVKLKAMEANALSTRYTYDNFVTRLRETQGQDGIVTPDAKVISHASLPLSPRPPGRSLLVAASVPAGLLLGLLFALIAERGGVPSSRTYPQIERPSRPQISPPVIAEVPNALDINAPNLLVDWPRSGFAVAISSLLKRIAPDGAQAQVVAIASDCPEAAGAISIALSRAAALSGQRAMLIDGDLGRQRETPSAMGLPPSQAGLVEVLDGALPLGRAVQTDPRSGAWVLSGSMRRDDAGAVLATPIFGQLIAQLKRSCHLVIVRAPAEHAAQLTGLADCILIVIAKPRAHSAEAARMVESVAHAKGRVGVVLAS
ncbi:MAG: hypothetical protein JOZ55_02770 [Alphaproteobacteria bacterium]|nr:hypothetical protein [Alphaproteobacteria bacterium]